LGVDRLIEVACQTRRWLIVAVAAQAVMLAGMLHVDGLFVHVGMDFLTSYTAAEMIADGAASDLYDTRAQWEYQRPIIETYQIDWGDRIMHPFISPPTLGVLAIPLLVLGPTLGYVAWALLNLAAVGVGVWLLVRRMDVAWQTSTAVIVGSLPVFMLLMLGQVEGLLFLAFVVFVTELREGREVRSGLALAVFAIKPPLLLAPLLYLAITGRRRATWTAILAIGGQAAASMALVGPKGVREYVELSRRLSGADGTTVTNVWGMVNLRSIVVRAFPVDDRLMINATIVLLTGATLAATCWFWRRAGQEAVSLPCLALLAVTTVLTSYHALYHTTTIALIGVVLLVAHANANRDRMRADRLTAFAWATFSLLPLLAFVIVQTSKVPAAFGVVGVALLWAVAAGTVAQQVATSEAATRPARAELRPWYVVGRE
jgi:hypothetical protein